MLPYAREIKVSGRNYSVSEWYPAYRDTPGRLSVALHIAVNKGYFIRHGHD